MDLMARTLSCLRERTRNILIIQLLTNLVSILIPCHNAARWVRQAIHAGFAECIAKVVSPIPIAASSCKKTPLIERHFIWHSARATVCQWPASVRQADHRLRGEEGGYTHFGELQPSAPAEAFRLSPGSVARGTIVAVITSHRLSGGV